MSVAVEAGRTRVETVEEAVPKERGGWRRWLSRTPLNIVLILIALFWLLPTIGLFFSSVRPESANAQSGWWGILTAPAEFTVQAYKGILEDPKIVDGLWNTFMITVPSTLGVIFIGALAAYAFAWMRFRGRDGLFLLVVALLVVPLQVALLPVASLYGRLGIYGSIAGVVLFHVGFGLPFAIFLLRNFFAGIPAELLEAARMDGAGEWRVFSRVVLPLGIPAIASLAIFQFLWVWNDLLVALSFATGGTSPITSVIREQLRGFGTSISTISAASFLSMVVPLIVFFAFQRYFVQGLLAGSGK